MDGIRVAQETASEPSVSKKRAGNLWPAEELSAFEEGFCCTELSWCNFVIPCGFA